jgi:hypothetical protein
MTCILLVTIALFVKTFSALEKVKLGFDPLKPNVAHEAASAAQRFSSNLFSHMTLFFY